MVRAHVKTIGNTLSWKQNLTLYNIRIVAMIASNIISFVVFGFHIIVSIVTTILCKYLMIYSYYLREESEITTSYKLIPISYTLLLNSLLLANRCNNLKPDTSYLFSLFYALV
jgi:hypothetical protein